MLSKIISFVLIYTIYCNSLFAQVEGDQKLVNALSGLSFLARSNKVTESVLKKFIDSNKDDLDKHQLTPKFQKLMDLMLKMKNCGNVQMSFDFANPFLQGIEPCNGGGNLKTSDLEQLFSSLDKIQNELNGDKNSIDQEKFKKLADKVYQEQKKMYMGAAYLAYSKYREPGISFENFLRTWALKEPNPNLKQFGNLNANAYGPYQNNQYAAKSPFEIMKRVINLSPPDKEWAEKLEDAAREERKKSPNASQNVFELSKKSSAQLRDIYNNYQALEDASRNQNEFEMTVNQVRRVVGREDDTVNLIDARAFENPFEQGFDILSVGRRAGLSYPIKKRGNVFNGSPETGLDNPFERLRIETEKERKFQEGVRFDVANSPILSHYVSEIQKDDVDIIILDDSLSKNAIPLSYKNVESRSPIVFLNKYGLGKDADERLKYSSDKYIADNFKGKKVITVTEIMRMHQELMSQKGLFGDDLTKARSNMSKNWLSNYENLQESRNTFNQTDGRLLKIAANAGENAGGLTIFTGSRRRLKIAENKQYNLSTVEVDKVDPFYGLGPNKSDIKGKTVNTLLDIFLDQSKQLMSKVSENYYNQSPTDFLQDSIYYHPALVNQIIAEDPSLAGVICALPAMKIKDEARSKRNKEIYNNVQMVVGVAAIFLTAGIAAPITFGLGVGALAYNTNLGIEASKNYDYANKVYNTTGQLSGKDNYEAVDSINDQYKITMSYFQDLIIEGALTPLQINAFVKTLPTITTEVKIWKKLSSNPQAIKEFFRWYNIHDAQQFGIGKVSGKLKDYAKDSLKED
jgi:hypothetical protein